MNQNMAEEPTFQEMVESNVKQTKEIMRKRMEEKLEKAIEKGKLVLKSKDIGVYYDGM